MDVQHSIVERIADFDPGSTEHLAGAVDAARAAGVPVVYVVVGFRTGHPETTSSPQFSALPEGAFTDGDPGAAIHADVAPRLGESLVTKKRVSAFAGSDLELVLRGAGVDHLVLTRPRHQRRRAVHLRQAADLDYRLTVLTDGCGDADEEVHRMLTEKVIPRQADVTTIIAWAASLA